MARGPVAAWVVEDGRPAPDRADASAPLSILLFDAQFHVEAGAEHHYQRTATQLLAPQALAAMGNVGLVWSPATQTVVVHHLNILRDGETIDVLAAQAFETLRREENLEQAMLDGRLTAVLQPAGLRVGDIVDFAYTVTTRDPVTAGHAEGAIDLNFPLTVEKSRFRASWPSDRPMRVRAGQNWTALPVRRTGGLSSVEIVRQNDSPIVVPDDAPTRFHSARLIELSDYADWGAVAAVLTPLYDAARRLEDDSPLRAEVERIRALSDDPAVQALAALRLVQDEVRYVALVMGEGALTPASADETWRRRFGDCKGKTVLLLALLDALGIPAEPAAVSLALGDGLDERLPRMGAFDHVIVRLMLDGQVRWMDGATTGDRSIEGASMLPYVWALPLRNTGSSLERIIVPPLSEPTLDLSTDIDATAGRLAPAPVTGVAVMRGRDAVEAAAALGLAPAAQRDALLKTLWLASVREEDIDTVSYALDPERGILTVRMTGETTLAWDYENVLLVPGASFSAPRAEVRGEGPFKDTPHAIAHPNFSRQTVRLRLPDGGRGFRVVGGRVDYQSLGHSVLRTMDLDGDLLTATVTIRTTTPEVSAEQARLDRAADTARPANRARIAYAGRLTDEDRAALAAEAPTTAEGWINRAVFLSQGGDIDGAVAATDKAIELAPDNANAWANRGVYRVHAGDLAGAASDLDRAFDLDPSERVTMNGYALLAMREGRYEDVIVEMSRALRQAPRDVFALNLRASAYVMLGQHERALRDVDLMIAVEPDNVDLQIQAIGLLSQLGRNDEGRRRLDVLAATDPDDPQLAMKVIGALNQLGQPDEADAIMARLLRDHPNDRLVLLNHAALRLARGDAQEALVAVDTLLANWPADASGLALKADALVELGHLDQIESEFARQRQDGADDAAVLNRLCWIAATEGILLDQALKDCDAALALEPQAANIIDSRGRVLLQLGDATRALAAYDAALAINPRLAPSLYGRGLARAALGEDAEGEADKATALLIDPGVARSFTNYVAPGFTAP